MTNSLLSQFTVSMWLLGAATHLPAAELAATPGEQVPASVMVKSADDSAEEVQVPLLLYAPDDYADDGQAWPLLLFLHGYGESGAGGDELERVALHGPPKQAAAGRELPLVVISPQCPVPSTREQIVRTWRPEVLLPLVDRAEEELNIDPRRVYISGLSMGGFGTWRVAAAAPERFAAAVPICGGGQVATMAEPLAGLPIWAFHGAQDNVVPLSRSVEMVDAVKAAGGRARLTVYPEAGHDAWTATYDNPMFYDWLLGHRRPEQN